MPTGNEFVGVLNTVMPKYLKGAADLTVRKRLWLAMLERRGAISFNHSSYTMIWDVEYAEPPVESYADGGQLTFSVGDYYKQAELNWRGYKVTDKMTEKQRDMMADSAMIVRRYKKKIPKLMKTLRNKFGSELYVDGSAAGNENRLDGGGTWKANDGNTVAGDRIANPSDTYAGLSTTAAQYDTWTSDGTAPNATLATDWPEGGSGDTAGYDYWSPKLANWSSTAWGTSSTAWIDNGEFVLRKLLQWLRLTAGADGASLLALLAGDLFTDFKNAHSTKGRFLVPHQEANDLGFPDVLNFEGLALQSEFGTAMNTGWVINADEMELQSLKPQLFGKAGPDWDPHTASWLFQAGFFGNLNWHSPKFHAYMENYA